MGICAATYTRANLRESSVIMNGCRGFEAHLLKRLHAAHAHAVAAQPHLGVGLPPHPDHQRQRQTALAAEGQHEALQHPVALGTVAPPERGRKRGREVDGVYQVGAALQKAGDVVNACLSRRLEQRVDPERLEAAASGRQGPSASSRLG